MNVGAELGTQHIFMAKKSKYISGMEKKLKDLQVKHFYASKGVKDAEIKKKRLEKKIKYLKKLLKK